MLKNMAEGYGIKGVIGEVHRFQCPDKSVQALSSAHCDRGWVYIYAGHLPSQFLHQLEVGAIAAAHI